MSFARQYKFAAASRDEPYVYGAERPGYNSQSPIPGTRVDEWVEYMQQQGIKRVCCLLQSQLSLYESDLLAAYRRWFGDEALCWAPIEDYQFADEALLTETILPFLADCVSRQEPVVVHCSGGIGRTGHVLAAWLVYAHGMTNGQAIGAVIAQGRNPHEAERLADTGGSRLNQLLDVCRAASMNNSTR